MRVIFNADDFGVSLGTNKAIEKAFREGVLTSTSIRTNGVAFADAIRVIKKNSRLGLGLHLNITDGKAHTQELADKRGFYKYKFLEYLLRAKLGDKKLLASIRKDFEYQFVLMKKQKVKFDHVDGQDHIQMIPEVFTIVCRLSKKYQIRAIRLSNEPLALGVGIIKAIVLKILSRKNIETLKQFKLLTSDAFFGVVHTNQMDENAVFKILNAEANKNQTIEIALHPAFPHYPGDKIYTSPFFAKYSNLPNRKKELRTLLSKKIRKLIRENDISLIRFSDLAK